MQRISKILLGVGCSVALIGVPVTGIIEGKQSTNLINASKVNYQLKNSLNKLQHSSLVHVTKVKTNENDATIKRNGEAVGSAEITLANAISNNEAKSAPDYAKSQSVIQAMIDNSQNWRPATTPWLNQKDLKCQFVFGPLNSNKERQVAWIFTNQQNQICYLATGLYGDTNNNGTSFYSISLYTGTNTPGIGATKYVYKPNVAPPGVSSHTQSSSSMKGSVSNGSTSSQK